MRLVALLLGLSAALAWGFGGIALRKGVAHVAPTTVLVVQYALGAAVVALWVAATGGAGAAIDSVGRRWPLLLLVVALQVGGYVCFVVGIKHAGPGSLSTSAVVAIAACYPALVAVLSGPLLGERLGWNDAVGVALVLAGVVVTQLR
jgi:drug/metabolite transporter (DMT)-like permease